MTAGSFSSPCDGGSAMDKADLPEEEPVACDLWDDVFHGCAVAAFVELARASGGPPDSDSTRQLAYRYYEEELANRNRQKSLLLEEPVS